MTTSQNTTFISPRYATDAVQYLAVVIAPATFPTGPDGRADVIEGPCDTVEQAQALLDNKKSRDQGRITEGEAIIARNAHPEVDGIRNMVAHLRAMQYAIYTRTVSAATPL